MDRSTLCKFIVAIFLSTVVFLPSAVGAEDVTEAIDDHFARIVDFAVSRDPVLSAQREVMEAARALDELKPRDLQMPEYARTSLLEVGLESTIQVQKAQETYSQIKKELVTALSRDITEILSLKNKIKFQTELQKLLEKRMESVERQVQAGIVDPENLWQLSEKIIDVQIAVADARDRKGIRRREIAFNYGNEDWRELLELLENLENLELTE